MIKNSNALAKFVDDCLVKCDGNKIEKEKMYEVYVKYTNQGNMPRLSKTQLSRRLPKYARYILEKHDIVRNWTNVDFKDVVANLDTLDTSKNII